MRILVTGGDGYTVKEVIDTAQQVTGRDIATRMGQRRAGDPAVLIASSKKISLDSFPNFRI